MPQQREEAKPVCVCVMGAYLYSVSLAVPAITVLEYSYHLHRVHNDAITVVQNLECVQSPLIQRLPATRNVTLELPHGS